MRCTVLKSFGTAKRGYGVGETDDFPEAQAQEFIRLGYAKPAQSVPETASLPESVETAVQPEAKPRKQRKTQ